MNINQAEEITRLTVGFAARVDMVMNVGAVSETITVSGASPLVDTTSTAITSAGSFAAVAGPRRRRTLEGASTTSHADIRWLPRLPAAEHT